jgi:hypothetical protein
MFINSFKQFITLYLLFLFIYDFSIKNKLNGWSPNIIQLGWLWQTALASPAVNQSMNGVDQIEHRGTQIGKFSM